MRVLSALLLTVAASGVAALPSWSSLYSWMNDMDVWHPTPSDFTNWLASDPTSTYELPDKITGENMYLFRQEMLKRAHKLGNQVVHKYGESGSAAAEEYPYFKWIPDWITDVKPDAGTVYWSAPCFTNNSATLTTNADGISWKLEITTSTPSGWFCDDFYLLATVEGLKFQTLNTATTTTINWNVNANTTSAAELWDLKTKGIRIMRFLDSAIPTIENLLATVMLFDGELQKDVSADAIARNLDFMQKYAGRTMAPRSTQEVIVDESQIASGDFFGIIRLDGLDPMLAWAMGSSTGHTTVALWMDGALNICESTTKDIYWPTNGIQCTPYRTWLAQAKAAQYSVVHAPLTAEARAKFNVTAAIQFFKDHAGLDYGFYNLLFGWIDTLEANYVCLPPKFTTCLRWNQVEILFGIIDKLVPAASDLLVNQAWNNRLGTKKLRTADIYYTAYKQGIDSEELPVLPELDSYVYDTNKNGVPAVGKSMVCCVFVCNIWKAGGLFSGFADQVNCGELTNWDDYSLAILDSKTPRPQQCIDADPTNQLCQIEGAYTLTLNDYASKAPYPHMAEKCPSQPPLYLKPANC